MKKNIYTSLIFAWIFSFCVNATEIINTTSKTIKISNLKITPNVRSCCVEFELNPFDLNPGEKTSSQLWDAFTATIIENAENKKYRFYDISEALISFVETINGEIKAYQEKNGQIKEITPIETTSRIIQVKNNTSKKLTILPFRKSEYIYSRGPVALDEFSIEPGENDKYDWIANSVYCFEAYIEGDLNKYSFCTGDISELLITFHEIDGKIKLSIEQSLDNQYDNRIVNITVDEGTPVCYACCDDYVCTGFPIDKIDEADNQRTENDTYLKNSCIN